MGQANNSGRNASLDNKKLRAAGRQQHDPVIEAILDAQAPLPAKGQTGGAFGREGVIFNSSMDQSSVVASASAQMSNPANTSQPPPGGQ